MLLFIQKRLSAEWMAELFQYISCYSLSEYGNLKKLQKSCFNTSHVTLYRVKTQLRADHPRSFNTSHVTLYLNVKQFIEKRKRVSIHLMLLFILLLQPVQNCQARFQYISCYSLSNGTLTPSDVEIRFNTSHVTLYLLYHVFHVCCKCRFNTSHVTLYRFLRSHWTHGRRVSIHLMLLFIAEKDNKDLDERSFNTSHVTLYHLETLFIL